MKKTMIVVSIVTIMAMLVGCAPEVTQADETPAPVSQTAQVILAEGDVATPVPEPEVVLTDLPDDAEIPDFYSEVLIPGVAERVFAFTDDTGKTQLRAYGELVPVAGSADEIIAGFFPIEVIQTGEDESGEPVYSVEVVSGVQDVVKEQGEAAGTGALIEPDDSILIPEGFEPVDSVAGLCTYSLAEGEVYYFAYCEFTEEDGKFYPADENGVVVPGALPVVLDEEGNILVILDVNGEIIYTSVVEPDVAEGAVAEDENAKDETAVNTADKEEKTETNNKSDSKKDSKPAATQKPESKPDSGSTSSSGQKDNDSQQDDTPTPPQPEPTPDTSTVEDEDDEIIVDPYADCTLVGRTVCNTCGADITHKIAEHGMSHSDEENFSYREQMGYKFPDGHIEWFG